MTVRHQLTPLTALTLDVGRAQDRFEFSPLRDSDSTSASSASSSIAFALIKGSASIGYRDFQPLSLEPAGLQGHDRERRPLVCRVRHDAARACRRSRDVQYSFDINEPYYLLTGVSVSLARRVVRPVDVVGRVGVQKLAYRDRIGAASPPRDRIDYVRSFGGGVGYHMGNDIRIGFNVDRQHRTSPVANREYHGLRFGTSVTYGL